MAADGAEENLSLFCLFCPLLSSLSSALPRYIYDPRGRRPSPRPLTTFVLSSPLSSCLHAVPHERRVRHIRRPHVGFTQPRTSLYVHLCLPCLIDSPIMRHVMYVLSVASRAHPRRRRPQDRENMHERATASGQSQFIRGYVCGDMLSFLSILLA